VNIRHSSAILLGTTAVALALLGPSSSGAADGTNRAQQTLDSVIANKEKKAASGSGRTDGVVLRLATPAELERLYLEGKITAKEYQRRLADYKAQDATLRGKDPQTGALEVLKKDAAKAKDTAKAKDAAAAKDAAKTKEAAAAKAKAAAAKEITKEPPKNPPPVTALPVPKPEDAPEHKALTDAEKKFDQLLEKKAEREKGVKAATPTPEPKTKREKLDALLRQLVDGKLTEAEYEQKRAKLVAEPD